METHIDSCWKVISIPNTMGGSSNRTEQLLHLAQVSAEKCELLAAREYYRLALQEIVDKGHSSGTGLPIEFHSQNRTEYPRKFPEIDCTRISETWSPIDFRLAMEAITGLLRMADEAQDVEALTFWERQLDLLIATSPKNVSPFVWYGKGLISEYRKDYRSVQKYLHRALRLAKKEAYCQIENSESISEEEVRRTKVECEKMQARAWAMLALMFMNTGRVERAQRISEQLLKLYEGKRFFAVNTPIYIILALLAEKRGKFLEASQWLKKAHASSVGEHNWYQYLYVLVNMARLNRLQRNYSQALWYLEIVDQATMGPEFSRFKSSIRAEKMALDRKAADLVIDSRRGWVKTRESEQIQLKKQYILLNLLEELSKAHASTPIGGNENSNSGSAGLTKSELIERVWKEKYRPQVHDNKLYYNINRLRKLIEPDMKNPQYLLSWREGYRLAPGLRIQWIQSANIVVPGLEKNISESLIPKTSSGWVGAPEANGEVP